MAELVNVKAGFELKTSDHVLQLIYHNSMKYAWVKMLYRKGITATAFLSSGAGGVER